MSEWNADIPGFNNLWSFAFYSYLLFFILSIYFLVLFWKKKKKFVNQHIIFLILVVIFGVIFEVWSFSIDKALIPELIESFNLPEFATELGLDKQDLIDFGRSESRQIMISRFIWIFVIAIIWISYLFRSRRVKNTFIR